VFSPVVRADDRDPRQQQDDGDNLDAGEGIAGDVVRVEVIANPLEEGPQREGNHRRLPNPQTFIRAMIAAPATQAGTARMSQSHVMLFASRGNCSQSVLRVFW
jgi:hypothetical protein